MKAVILAGGYGSRISEESYLKPKPLIEIGEKPILWHIMKLYSLHGINDFIICLGYKGYLIKEYFANYFLHTSDFTIDLPTNKTTIHKKRGEDWKITLVDTGGDTMTGGRIKRIQEYVGQETFCLTYGDGVADINIKDLIEFHCSQKLFATITGVKPPGRFGNLLSTDNKVTQFNEKPQGDGSWINGGFFVLEPEIFKLIQDDSIVWEKEPLNSLVAANQLACYKHDGFWHAMDTLRDKNYLEELVRSGNSPWVKW